MARIYQRSGKKGVYWYLDYNVDGRRLRKRVGRSKRLADLALADIQVTNSSIWPGATLTSRTARSRFSPKTELPMKSSWPRSLNASSFEAMR